MALEVKTTRVDQAQRLTARGDIEPIYRVAFMVGENGPFFLEFSPADFLPDNVRRAQQKIAETIQQL